MRLGGRERYLQALLAFENFGQGLAGANAQGVAQELDLLDVVIVLELLQVRLNVLGGGEFEALALEGEDFGCRHVIQASVGQQASKDVQEAREQAWLRLGLGLCRCLCRGVYAGGGVYFTSLKGCRVHNGGSERQARVGSDDMSLPKVEWP